ncbi:envelope stress response membrane protein PspB [Sphingomonas immobilis]|uniref:Envelope stress response membrane protein PspB n=1 Tax=Sphingomonas immobilis TaxID=3063997 RepID=A0ABT9A269_9SPHN|nr:envelope stress response membrane protein PspB [Sphingomonas sp. CA1-15]MDO7842812.1 envelope stress response membrane protein PspB [Sphingomonas sp. CA1-15]
MEDIIVPVFVCGLLFVGMPWVILHYVTKWKQAPKITNEDEKLLDELHFLARRLEDRVATVERIIAADHPGWRPGQSIAEPNPEFDPSRRN